MKKLKTTLLLVILSNLSLSQDFYLQFTEAFRAGDTTKQLTTLQLWEKSDSADAELYTSYFNYYFSKSQKEIVRIFQNLPEGESFSLTDSSGKLAGFLGSDFEYEESNLKKSLDKINRGIELHPNRLDMRFGKITVFKRIEDWQSMTSEIVATINYSVLNKNEWTWTNNEEKEDGESFFLTSMHSYQLDLYNTEDDDLLVNMRVIGKKVIEHYPNHIQSISNVAITYLLVEKYDSAIHYLKIAERINPEDDIILNNIAESYSRMNDNENTLIYLRKTLKYADERNQARIQKRIDELENKSN